MSSFCTRSQQSRSSPATPAGHQGSIWMVVSKYLELVGNILVLVDHGEWRLFIGSARSPQLATNFGQFIGITNFWFV